MAAHGPVVFSQRASRALARRGQAKLAAVARTRALRRAWRLPATPVPVHLPAASGTPLVSIVVPAYNNWRYTNGCLRALAASHDASVPTEFIVVDDASTDRTRELLALCTGVRVVTNERNAGFVDACNAGARAARGTYLHFLNNDAFVSEGWLQPLLETFAADSRVGAVVSQLRYPDETVSEAGGVVWRDGQGSNYGRGAKPSDWRYGSLREVDYGSGASLIVRADAFWQAGGFSPEFAPAYYEDADLCFALRAAGHRVMYQPRSVVYHAEGVSYGSNARADARSLQGEHRQRFAAKWHDALQHHREPNPDDADRAARRLSGSKTILIVDDHVPFIDRDAGSRRIAFLIDLLRERRWHVVFGTIDPSEYPPYADLLRARGADLLLGMDEIAAARNEGLRAEVYWLCRPEPAARFLRELGKLGQEKLIFDTVDLHYLRLEREERVSTRQTNWQAMRQAELQLASTADVTVVTSEAELQILAQSGIENVHMIPVIEPSPATPTPGWESREGIIFLGNYAHSPNVDAAVWLCSEIMPLVWETLPHVHLTLAGNDPPSLVRTLAAHNVAVPGYLPDVDPLVDAARVFAAPLRFGAGVKGKIVRALAHGIPVVTTPTGAEGIFGPDEREAVAVTAREFADDVIHLHEDRDAWERAVQRGHVIAARFSPGSVDVQLGSLLDGVQS